MLTDEQDKQLFADIYNFYKKYKDPSKFRDAGVWDDMLREAGEIQSRHKQRSFVQNLISAVYGEVYGNYPKNFGYTSLFD